MINKYVKRPVQIEAVKFEYTAECLLFLHEWMGENMKTSGKDRTPDAKGWVIVGTLEDSSEYQVNHMATEGDYIIKGVKGEFYPCKPAIFSETYLLVE